MFENVTYTYYSDTLGRAVIPSETEFNKYTFLNEQKLRNLLPFIEERLEGGIDSAVCLWNEIDYKAEHKNDAEFSGARAVASESVSGHSVSYDSTQETKESELNAKSIEARKMEALKLFCFVEAGV